MNRRHREITQQIQAYNTLIKYSTNIRESLIYQGKLETLQREQKEIEERYKKQ